MLEEDPTEGCRFAFTENAFELSVVRTVELPSSVADKITDWIPIGLMKYCTGEPGMSLCVGPYDLWFASMCEIARPQLCAFPLP